MSGGNSNVCRFVIALVLQMSISLPCGWFIKWLYLCYNVLFFKCMYLCYNVLFFKCTYLCYNVLFFKYMAICYNVLFFKCMYLCYNVLFFNSLYICRMSGSSNVRIFVMSGSSNVRIFVMSGSSNVRIFAILSCSTHFCIFGICIVFIVKVLQTKYACLIINLNRITLVLFSSYFNPNVFPTPFSSSVDLLLVNVAQLNKYTFIVSVR